MGLDKAILHGKEHRRPYTGAKAIDRTCQNHGSCGWCRDNRTYQSRRKMEKAGQDMEENDEVRRYERDFV